jgi:hypothetical protein
MPHSTPSNNATGLHVLSNARRPALHPVGVSVHAPRQPRGTGSRGRLPRGRRSSRSAPGRAVRPFSVVPNFYPAYNSAYSPWSIPISPALPPRPPIVLSDPNSLDTPVPATQLARENTTSVRNQQSIKNDEDGDELLEDIFYDLEKKEGI